MEKLNKKLSRIDRQANIFAEIISHIADYSEELEDPSIDVFGRRLFTSDAIVIFNKIVDKAFTCEGHNVERHIIQHNFISKCFLFDMSFHNAFWVHYMRKHKKDEKFLPEFTPRYINSLGEKPVRYFS
jgi:hypothetical protein